MVCHLFLQTYFVMFNRLLIFVLWIDGRRFGSGQRFSFRWLIGFTTTCTNRLTCSFLVNHKNQAEHNTRAFDK